MYRTNACYSLISGDPFTCPRVGQFKCQEGKFENGAWVGPCVAISYVEEGIFDCPDRSDECKWLDQNIMPREIEAACRWIL